MGSPARQKRLGLSFFAPSTPPISLPFLYLLSGQEGLSGLAFLAKLKIKWVCWSGLIVFWRKIFDKK